MLKRSKLRLRGEWLEIRNLLAVDLAVDVSGLPNEIVAGQEVDFVVDVRNLGDHDALDVQVESIFPDNFENVRWSRSAPFPAVVDLDRLNGRDGISLAGRAKVAGDLNGDGFDDLLIGSRKPTDHFPSAVSIVFGSSLPNDASTFELSNSDVENGSTIHDSDEDPTWNSVN